MWELSRAHHHGHTVAWCTLTELLLNEWLCACTGLVALRQKHPSAAVIRDYLILLQYGGQCCEA